MNTSDGHHRGANSRKKSSKSAGDSCSNSFLISWALLLSCFGVFFFWDSGSSNTSIIVPSDGAVVNPIIDVERLKALPDNLSGPEQDIIDQNVITEVLEKSDVHVVFSTDCSTFQDWQSLLLFHSARIVGQNGPVTRIASGCDEEKKSILTALYKKVHPYYHVHFTPDFTRHAKMGVKYDYNNKPFGVKHWLEFAEPKISDGVAVVVVDPDMIFVRPITTTIRGQDNTLYDKKLENEMIDKVMLGRPVAQMYGLGAPWTNDTHLKFNRLRTCGPGSPCMEIDRKYGDAHFSVGPPYIMIKEDMVRLTETWTQFLPRVYVSYPHLLAEMYAYSMAAAHENLPHLQLESYMVSDTGGYGEGWPHIDRLKDVCIPPVHGIYYPGEPLPNLVHYCQSYRVGELGFYKRRVPRDIFSCLSPLLVEPPADLGFATYQMDREKKITLKPRTARMHAYQVCVINRSMNAALIDYKQKMCRGKETNLNKTLNILTLRS